MLHVICYVHGTKWRDRTHALAFTYTHLNFWKQEWKERKRKKRVEHNSIFLFHILFAWWWIENISRLLLDAMRLIIEFSIVHVYTQKKKKERISPFALSLSFLAIAHRAHFPFDNKQFSLPLTHKVISIRSYT